MSFQVTPTSPESPASPVIPVNGLYTPDITFGIEIECVFAVRRPAIELSRNGDLGSITLEDRHKFLIRILNHQLAHNILTPSVLNGVRLGEAYGPVDYNYWSVTCDSSVGASETQVAARFGTPKEEFETQQWTWDSAEIVSPSMQTSADNIWVPMLHQIEADLLIVPGESFGAFTNQTTGLHVHLAFQNEEQMTLRTLQNLYILYGVCEEEIGTIHPESRRPPMCEYAQSVRRQCVPYSHHQFARGIYRTQSLDALHRATTYSGSTQPRYSQITISLARQESAKPLTIEFRQHKGSLKAEEMKWWVKFCEGMLRLANRLDQIGFILLPEFAGPDIFDQMKNCVFESVLPTAGLNFYASKVLEYENPEEDDEEDEYED